MKYLTIVVLSLSLLSCQSDSGQSNQKNETPELTTSSKANQSTPSKKIIKDKPAIQEPELKTVIFVCNYGFDKSVIATSYFNEVIKDKGFHYEAISRAAKPNQRKTSRVNFTYY